eukprot:CAMPEP_0198294298 /NCGR_PEP_ID=MMETSP1449-20131203/21658_1 /TAXON_ID=420275 /ORGANISM="Attheya septentrionalis, Strain CCMP2084" /LENGTH=506 /DNA_ID=CAMNT_0043994207 /DNA_START=253 /DNA_END=1773 /DNA_ORIENTATION=-
MGPNIIAGVTAPDSNGIGLRQRATSQKKSSAPTPVQRLAPKHSQSDEDLDSKVMYEFGGPWGVTALMLLMPLLMFYFLGCLEFHGGKLVVPSPAFWEQTWEFCRPNRHAAVLYMGFNVVQAFTAMTLPGVVVKGLPVPSLQGKQLDYLCNGVATWYFDIVILCVLHYTGILRLTEIMDNIGPIMTVAILWGIFVTVAIYVWGIVTKTTHRMSGNTFYDLFMGAILNPRIGNLDLKIWSEIRIPWKLLFLITASAAMKEHDIYTEQAIEEGLDTTYSLLGGLLEVPICRTSAPLLFMFLAHILYVNACMKGEECIPTTWDIFYEKWGYMLIFWNFAGVPFSYCYSSIYILNRSLQGNPVTHSNAYNTVLFCVLVAAYYVWDTANSQKNRFRMKERGTYVERNTFPQLPWGTLKKPTYIQTKHGNKLLTGGWWGVARKIHYTADLTMAMSWGLMTGFDSFIPYFYVCFFTAVLVHRVGRDMVHCKEKYGDDWDEYCRTVPYIFIPLIF